MFLEALQLTGFKNYGLAQFSFQKRIHIITGKNGTGKTNLLDSIWYLGNGKSYFNYQDIQLIKDSEQYFQVKGTFKKDNKKDNILCACLKGKKRAIKVNEVEVNKITAYYGTYPMVMIAPQDVELVYEGNEVRRKWMDSVISLYDNEYLIRLLSYNRFLDERNGLLKSIEVSANDSQKQLLSYYAAQMNPFAQYIYKQRINFIQSILPILQEIYEGIAPQSPENMDIVFTSDAKEDNLLSLIAQSMDKDIILKRTTVGIHTDSIEFVQNQKPIKKFGSQGQMKSFLIALKLASAKLLEEKTKRIPILLIDDFSERLDGTRLQNLSEWLIDKTQNQIFITDTGKERLERFFTKTAEYYNT